MHEVSLVECRSYELAEVKEAVRAALLSVGALDTVRQGDRVAIKANLVSAHAPDTATTTHPSVLIALTELVLEKGASQVVIGDSPGGLYTQGFLERVYKISGLYECEKHGAILNRDFSESHAVYDEAISCKTFTYTGYLDNADVIIDACKLKTHGMMALSCAAKNMFGVIPGTMKPEYHFRYPSYEAFANMIIDLDEYFKPSFSVCDAVVAMEGNGPTQGNPRPIGCIIASRSPHKLDLVAAKIIGLDSAGIPTLQAAKKRGLIPDDASSLDVDGNISAFAVSDFDNVGLSRSLLFRGSSDSVLGNIFGSIAKAALTSRPKLKKKQCIGCGKCAEICPAKAIKIEKKKAIIDRNKCILCFCCQEFCPVGAMKVHRTFIAKMLEGGKGSRGGKKQ